MPINFIGIKGLLNIEDTTLKWKSGNWGNNNN